MANQRRRDRQRNRAVREEHSTISYSLPYDRRNGLVFLAAIVLIVIGYICMAQPPVNGFLSLTLAPILLVISYVILIPVALLMKTQKELVEAADGSSQKSETAAQ